MLADLSGRVVPTFSPDRYFDAARRGWRTDADLLAEVTGVGTDDLGGFLEALQQRRGYFISRETLSTEHHSSHVPIARLALREVSEAPSWRDPETCCRPRRSPFKATC